MTIGNLEEQIESIGDVLSNIHSQNYEANTSFDLIAHHLGDISNSLHLIARLMKEDCGDQEAEFINPDNRLFPVPPATVTLGELGQESEPDEEFDEVVTLPMDGAKVATRLDAEAARLDAEAARLDAEAAPQKPAPVPDYVEEARNIHRDVRPNNQMKPQPQPGDQPPAISREEANRELQEISARIGINPLLEEMSKFGVRRLGQATPEQVVAILHACRALDRQDNEGVAQ